MGKILDEPQYPVVEKTPGFWRTGPSSANLQHIPARVLVPADDDECSRRSPLIVCICLCAVKNFNTADLGMAAAAAGFSVPIAYMAGEQVCMRDGSLTRVHGHMGAAATDAIASCSGGIVRAQ